MASRWRTPPRRKASKKALVGGVVAGEDQGLDQRVQRRLLAQARLHAPVEGLVEPEGEIQRGGDGARADPFQLDRRFDLEAMSRSFVDSRDGGLEENPLSPELHGLPGGRRIHAEIIDE